MQLVFSQQWFVQFIPKSYPLMYRHINLHDFTSRKAIITKQAVKVFIPICLPVILKFQPVGLLKCFDAISVNNSY